MFTHPSKMEGDLASLRRCLRIFKIYIWSLNMLKSFLMGIKDLTKSSNLNKESANIEHSLDDLKNLLELGYTTATFYAYADACEKCQVMSGNVWDLADMINTTLYNAPIFCRLHVNCKDYLLVQGDGLSDVIVKWDGIHTEGY